MNAERSGAGASLAAGASDLMRRLFPPQIEGYLDRIVADEAVGWAFDRRRPDRRVLIVARYKGRIVAECLADLPRRDLEGAGKGDGRCGFRLKIPSTLPEAARQDLAMEAVAGLRRRLLSRAKRFRVEEPAASAAPDPFRGPPAGFIERYVGGVLKGWAVDPNNPETPAQIDVFDGEVFLGAVRAEIQRPRLQESGAPFGARGFEFRMPDTRDVGPDHIRARISGTRIDLRRSRAFPGDLAGRGGPAAPSAGTNVHPAGAAKSPATGAVFESPRADQIAFVVCGENDAGDLGPSLTSVRAQGEPHPALAVLGPPLPEGVDAETFGPGNESGLRSFFRSAAMVAFLSPGQAAAPLAAQALRGAPAGDVLYWRAAGGAGLGPDPDLAVALGARTSGLAIRGDVLAALPPDFAASLAREGLGALEAWAAGAGLKWTELDEPIATPAARAGARSTRGAGERPRRLSLCAWSGWDEGPPLALRALLAGADGFDVEILAPADRAKGLQDQIAAWASPGARSLAVRPVDVPGAGGSAPLWRIMTLAATGQVAILCHGEAEVPPEALANLAAWAHRQDIGAATLPLRADTEGGLAGLTLELAGGFCTAAEAGVNGADLTGRPILAAPAAFMAISRAALAVADGFDADGAGELADLDLGLRLRGLGRRSVLLTGFQAEAPAELIRRWRRRVVSPSLISALSAGARADVAAFASLTAAPR